ncbi:MAG: hypothetical protein NVS3B2_18170 [Ramlibacter sp.]
MQRRASKAPPEQGGWNVFFTSSGGLAQSNPFMVVNMAANGEKAWFGWPSDEPYEKLRDKWVSAGSEDERKKIAVEIQQRAWDIIPHLYYGQWNQPIAHRKNVQGWLPVPEIIPFWNLTKTWYLLISPRLTVCRLRSRTAIDVTTAATIQASGDRAS